MKKKHLATQTSIIFFAVMGPLIALSIALFVYTCIKNYQYNKNTIEEAERSITQSVEEQINQIASFTNDDICLPEFLYFSNTSTLTAVTHYADQIAQTLHQHLRSQPIVRGIVLYNNKVDRMYLTLADTSTATALKGDQKYDALKQLFHEIDHPREKKYVTVTLNETTYLCYVVTSRYGSVAILIDPTVNDVYQTFRNVYEDQLSFVFSEEAPESSDSYRITRQVKNLPIYITYRADYLNQILGFNEAQILISVIIVLLLCTIIWAFTYLQKLMISPLLHLSDSFDIIASGDYDYRINRTHEIYEIDHFYKGFDHMLDTIRDAKEESYQQQMDAANAKLQYLQLQIRPHFYLNCLKNINSLAEMKDYEKIQELVISLSDYFRYNFQDVKNFVTIREELEAVQSYVNLCRCLYHEIDLEFDIENETLACNCLPLSILTFTENAIKHAKELKELTIRITAKIELCEDGDPYVTVTTTNNGFFPEELLPKLNEAHFDSFVYQKEHIGIRNVRYRLWLIYGENYNLHFKNCMIEEQPHAKVTLSLPLEQTPSIK